MKETQDDSFKWIIVYNFHSWFTILKSQKIQKENALHLMTDIVKAEFSRHSQIFGWISLSEWYSSGIFFICQVSTSTLQAKTYWSKYSPCFWRLQELFKIPLTSETIGIRLHFPKERNHHQSVQNRLIIVTGRNLHWNSQLYTTEYVSYFHLQELKNFQNQPSIVINCFDVYVRYWYDYS